MKDAFPMPSTHSILLNTSVVGKKCSIQELKLGVHFA